MLCGAWSKMQNFHRISVIFFIFFHNQKFIVSWDLSSYGISDNFFVSDIVIYFNRAFLALPRKICANNVSEPTFVEVPWKETGYFHPPRNTKITQGQIWAQCDDLQSATSLALEPRKSKLWILDEGNTFCPPKLMYYSLFLNSFGTNALEISAINGKKLSSIVVEDSFPENPRAFISNIGSNSILLVYLDSLKWQILRIREEKQPHISLDVDFLALSKMEPFLYLSGRESTKLFELDLRKLEGESVGINEIMAINVTLLGYKLGKSTAFETDFKHGLTYYLVNDFAVVRWITGTPMTAETHNVLAQSYHRLPYVSKIFTGPQNGIWALVNPQNPKKCLAYNKASKNKRVIQDKHGKKEKNEEDEMTLKHRVVKVMRFNRYFDDKLDNFNDLEY